MFYTKLRYMYSTLLVVNDKTSIMLHALPCFVTTRSIRTWMRKHCLEVGWLVCALITWFAVTHVYWYLAGCSLLVFWLYRWLYDTWSKYTTPPNDKTDCPICMESIDSDSFAWCTRCRYTFHKECHDQWDDVSTTCPMCRAEYGVIAKSTWRVSSFSHSFKVIIIVTLLLSILPGLYLIIVPCLFVLATMFKTKT